MIHMTRTDWAKSEIENLKEQGRYVPIRTIESPQGPRVTIEGKKYLNMCSNNYLGFANNDQIKKAAIDAIQQFGIGAGAVRSIAGTIRLHRDLENKVASFKHMEASVVYQGGLLANLAAVPVLVGKEDIVFSEELNHASIIDAVRLSSARRQVYKHMNMDDLERNLKEHRNEGKKALIISDGVFSMDGDIAPLDRITELGEQYDAMVYVDDAHGEGVLGSHGRGIVDHFNLSGRVDVEMGTFSKALGSMGGFVSGDGVLMDLMKQRSRPFLFSSALNAGDAAAVLKAIEILESDETPLKRLWDNSTRLKSGLSELGFNTGSSKTPITPVIVGNEKKAVELSVSLYNEHHLFASPIVYPTVAMGTARIRLMPSAAHSASDIDETVEAFSKAGKKLGILN